MVERQAKDLDIRGSNPGPGLNFSLEIKKFLLYHVEQYITC